MHILNQQITNELHIEKLTSIRYLVGKLNANSLESVMMTIGGATRFLTALIITNGTRQMSDTYADGSQTKRPPEKIKVFDLIYFSIACTESM